MSSRLSVVIVVTALLNIASCTTQDASRERAQQFYEENHSRDLATFFNVRIIKRGDDSYAINTYPDSSFFYFSNYDSSNPELLEVGGTPKEMNLQRYSSAHDIAIDTVESIVLRRGHELITAFEALGDLTELHGHPQHQYLQFYQGIESVVYYLPGEQKELARRDSLALSNAEELGENWYYVHQEF